MRERLGLGRRLDELEGAFGGERRCKCRVFVEDKDRAWAQTIILAHRGGDDSATCPDCGGQRIVVVMNPGFPLDDCECVECVRRAEDRPQPARASSRKRKPASPTPRSRPASTPARHPVDPKTEQPAEPPNEPKRPSERTGREWESQKSRRRSALSRGVTDAEF